LTTSPLSPENGVVSGPPGYVVSETAVEEQRSNGDTASVRTTIDASAGCERLVQRVIRFAPGRSRPRRLGDRQEVLFVVAGDGAIHVDGESHRLEPLTGAYVAAGEEYEIEAAGPGELVVVSVTAPQEHDAPPLQRTVRWEDRPSLPASPNREFRYLVNQDVGCLDVTQFVGVIPPGRAGMHSHTYDEVVYVLEGEGVLHRDGIEPTPIARGSCIHFPPFREHSLENVGETPLRVLGVFHPSGDPASRATEANQ
jgi:mannose-6-phosphate isomerase-like protein (cupin superfamily)